MQWMKAGRSKAGETRASTFMQKLQKPQEQATEADEDWKQEELSLFTDGYVALAKAVLLQCKKDRVKPSEEPEYCHAILRCYAERMARQFSKPAISTEDNNG